VTVADMVRSRHALDALTAAWSAPYLSPTSVSPNGIPDLRIEHAEQPDCRAHAVWAPIVRPVEYLDEPVCRCLRQHGPPRRRAQPRWHPAVPADPGWGNRAHRMCRGYRLAAVFRRGWVALARRVEVAVLRCLAVFVGRLVRLSMWASAMSSAVAIGETS
jgi:hypothetical protein